MNRADALAKANATPMPTQARKRAARASPAPMDCPTRVNIATPMLMGSMKLNEAKFSAIWCAATSVVPKRATSSAISPKALVSAK